MSDVKNVVFFAENNKTNVKIGNLLCKDGFSIAGYWLGDSGTNYDDISSDCGSLFVTPGEEEFKTFISYFLWDLGYKPDFVVIKGRISEFWGLSSLLDEGVLDVPCISLIENISVPFTGFDLMILDQFERNVVLQCPGFNNFIDYMKIIKKEKNDEILKNIVSKLLPLEDFGKVFFEDKEDEEIMSFVKEIEERILNKIIEREEVVSGAVII